MKMGGITRSTGFQVLLYILFGAGFLCGCFCLMVTLWLWDWGANETGFAEFEKRIMQSEAYEHLNYICSDEEWFPRLDEVIRAFEEESAAHNVKYTIYYANTDEILWTNNSSYTLSNAPSYETWWGGHEVSASEESYQEYRVVLHVDTNYAKDDEFRRLHELAKQWYYLAEWMYLGVACGFVLSLLSLIWILCNAGHRWRREGIIPGVLSNIYLDLLTAVFGFGALCILLLADEFYHYQSDFVTSAVIVAVVGTVEAVWCSIYLRELALRFKLGKWWQHTLIYTLGRLGMKGLRFLCKAFKQLVVNFPEIHLVVIVVVVLTLCEFMGICYFVHWGKGMVLMLWFLEKLIVIPVVLYCALAFQKLRKGSRALAQGDLSYKMDTQYLLLHFKEHGENLNRIGSGISKAVEERLQSERLKTELITNVSHDLKTPLTSVINYADLLAVAAAGDGEEKETQLQEYSEVLLRQAKRLKKLLEDLVEASKAATGNVELKLVPCELGVMLTQVAGEYEERFLARDLKLVMKKPEEEVRILADGRQLWRVFENLLNNICKYAQENSRVYLSMEPKDRHVEIIFRNISKYELDISPQELTERFVRGDASRHMEGSGLGLSIAKSLTELLNGTMEILTDGDLFKVILRFEKYEK